MSLADRNERFVSCGCRDELVSGRAFTLKGPHEPMPERSAFTDNCLYIRHYCEKHWKERSGDVAS
jgi:hypothetical protein